MSVVSSYTINDSCRWRRNGYPIA